MTIDDETDVSVPLAAIVGDEDKITEADGQKVADRLGINIPAWAEEVKGKVERAIKSANAHGACEFCGCAVEECECEKRSRARYASVGVARPLVCPHGMPEAECIFCPVDRELEKEGLL